MIDAMMYKTKTSCQWRMLPKDFDSCQTVYFYFRKWKFEDLFEEMIHCLWETVRNANRKKPSPSIGLIDSRSARTSHHVDSSEYGIDGGEKIEGRKKRIVFDTLGLPMAARVLQ